MGRFSTVSIPPVYQYVITSDVLFKDSNPKNVTSSTSTKLKEIQVIDLYPTPTTVRFFVDYQVDAQGKLTLAIYKNGSQVTSQDITADPSRCSTGRVTFDVSVAKGDYIQLYGNIAAAGIGACNNMVNAFGVLGVRQLVPSSDGFKAAITLT